METKEYSDEVTTRDYIEKRAINGTLSKITKFGKHKSGLGGSLDCPLPDLFVNHLCEDGRYSLIYNFDARTFGYTDLIRTYLSTVPSEDIKLIKYRSFVMGDNYRDAFSVFDLLESAAPHSLIILAFERIFKLTTDNIGKEVWVADKEISSLRCQSTKEWVTPKDVLRVLESFLPLDSSQRNDEISFTIDQMSGSAANHRFQIEAYKVDVARHHGNDQIVDQRIEIKLLLPKSLTLVNCLYDNREDVDCRLIWKYVVRISARVYIRHPDLTLVQTLFESIHPSKDLHQERKLNIYMDDSFTCHYVYGPDFVPLSASPIIKTTMDLLSYGDFFERLNTSPSSTKEQFPQGSLYDWDPLIRDDFYRSIRLYCLTFEYYIQAMRDINPRDKIITDDPGIQSIVSGSFLQMLLDIYNLTSQVEAKLELMSFIENPSTTKPDSPDSPMLKTPATENVAEEYFHKAYIEHFDHLKSQLLAKIIECDSYLAFGYNSYFLRPKSFENLKFEELSLTLAFHKSVDSELIRKFGVLSAKHLKLTPTRKSLVSGEIHNELSAQLLSTLLERFEYLTLIDLICPTLSSGQNTEETFASLIQKETDPESTKLPNNDSSSSRMTAQCLTTNSVNILKAICLEEIAVRCLVFQVREYLIDETAKHQSNCQQYDMSFFLKSYLCEHLTQPENTVQLETKPTFSKYIQQVPTEDCEKGDDVIKQLTDVYYTVQPNFKFIAIENMLNCEIEALKRSFTGAFVANDLEINLCKSMFSYYQLISKRRIPLLTMPKFDAMMDIEFIWLVLESNVFDIVCNTNVVPHRLMLKAFYSCCVQHSTKTLESQDQIQNFLKNLMKPCLMEKMIFISREFQYEEMFDVSADKDDKINFLPVEFAKLTFNKELFKALLKFFDEHELSDSFVNIVQSVVISRPGMLGVDFGLSNPRPTPTTDNLYDSETDLFSSAMKYYTEVVRYSFAKYVTLLACL